MDIAALAALQEAEKSHAVAQAEAIFFETASTRSFSGDGQRSAFRDTWFSKYARVYPGYFIVGRDASGAVRGYLAGCPDTRDAAALEIAGGIAYYTPELFDAVRHCPAHFHVNVAPGLERRGIGRALVAAFLGSCSQIGVKGVHTVTGVKAEAVRFYEACGFAAVTVPDWIGSLVLLTVDLDGRSNRKALKSPTASNTVSPVS